MYRLGCPLETKHNKRGRLLSLEIPSTKVLINLLSTYNFGSWYILDVIHTVHVILLGGPCGDGIYIYTLPHTWANI